MAIDYEKALRAAYLPSLDGKLPSQKQEDIYKFDGNFYPEQKEKAKLKSTPTTYFNNPFQMTREEYNRRNGNRSTAPVYGSFDYYKVREQKLRPLIEEIIADSDRTDDIYLSYAKNYKTNNAWTTNKNLLKISKNLSDKFDYQNSLINEYKQINRELDKYDTKGVHLDKNNNIDVNSGYGEANYNRQRYDVLMRINAFSDDELLKAFDPNVDTPKETQLKLDENKSNYHTERLEDSRANAYKYFGENKDKKYGDNIFGWGAGNYKLGRIGIKANTADYVAMNATTDDLEAGDVYLELQNVIQQNNKKTFENNMGFKGTVAMLGQYAPQALDQMLYRAGGKAIGKVVGLAAGIDPITVGNFGASAAVAQYMYSQTAGSTFGRMIREQGLSPEDAKKIAEDEALASSIIEFGLELGASIIFGGAKRGAKKIANKTGKTNFVSNFGNKLLKKMINIGIKEQTAKTILNVAKTAGKVTLDSSFEGVEEYWQTGVSFTADRYAKQGEETSPFKLLLKSLDFSQYTDDELSQMDQSFLAAFVLGHIQAGGKVVGNVTTNRVLNAITDNAKLGAEVYKGDNRELLINLVNAGKNSQDKKMRELANEVEYYIENNMVPNYSTIGKFVKASVKNDTKDVTSILKDAVTPVPSTEPSSKQVTPAQTDNKVISTEMSDVGKNETKHSIMRNSKGLYVQADRQVIKGDDPSQWGDQVTNYINTKIRNGNDVVVIAADGDPLTITADTEGKAHFRNYIDMGNGQKRLMTDEEYAVKLRAETHIDELAAVSKRGPKIVPDYKNHPFAVDGFNYRTAYFMDNDGQYYRLTISVGKNGLINTVYNVGKIKEAKYSLMAQRPGSNTVGSSASNNKVPQNNGFVNNQFMQNNENVASDNGNVEKSTKPLTIEQKIRAFLDGENERVSTATGKTLTEDAFSIVEPTTRKQKNLVKDCASLGIEVRYIKTQNNDIIGTSHNINGAELYGVIYINEDAQNPYRVVLGHEVTHQIKVTDINAYNALEDIARKHIGESFDNLTIDKQEEAVADFVGAVMDNPRAYKSVFQQNRNLLQRFIEAVDSIIGKFKGTETYNDDLGRMLNDTRAELTDEDAGETKRSRMVGEINENTLKSLHSIENRKSVFSFTTEDFNKSKIFANRMLNELGVKSPFFRTWFGDWRTNDNKTRVRIVEVNEKIVPDNAHPKNIGILLRNKLKNKELFRGNVVNTDTGYNIQIGAFGYNDTLTYAQRELRKNGVTTEEVFRRINALCKIDELIQNAILLDTEVIVDEDNPNRTFMHSFYVVAKVDGVDELIKIKVDELESPTNPAKRFYNLNDFEIINKKPFAVNWDLNPSTDTNGGKGLASTTISISDLFNLVKNMDANFKPQSSSVIVNADGTPKIVYHGTNAKGITIFKNKSGAYWFSESYDYAEAMAEERNGNTVMQVYLSMKKPYRVLLKEGQFSDPTYEKQHIEYAKQNDYDGVIFDVETDNDLVKDTFYVVFDSKQIKSATDNIGTFDKNNTNIKYSRMNENNVLSAASEQQSNVIDSNSKVNNYLRRARTMFVNDVEELMNIPKVLKNNDLKQVFNQLWNEYKESGKIAPESFNKVFDMLYENGKAISTEFYEQYKDLKADIRNTHFRITDDIKSAIPDFEQFRRRNISTFKTAADGVEVDSYYEELSELYPDLFPEDIIAPADRLLRIAEVAKSIKPQEDSFDTFSPEYKDHIRQQFENSFSKVTDEFFRAKRYLDDKVSVDSEEDVVYTAQDVKALYKLKDRADKAVKAIENKYVLSDKDKTTIERLLNGEITVDEIPKDTYKKAVLEIYKAKVPLYDAQQKIQKHIEGVRARFDDIANSLTMGSEHWKESKGIFGFSLKTAERVIRSIVPKETEANSIISRVFDPIHKSEAKKTRYINKYAKIVDDLHLTKEESAAVQFVGEKQTAMLNNGKDLTVEDVKKEIDNYFLINKDLDRDKITNAVKVFRGIYNEIYENMNDVLIDCGYAPVRYIVNYFPHFVDEDNDVLSKFCKRVGISFHTQELPGDLTGKTDTFKPGKTFFSHAIKRKGDITTYDAVEGFNRYIKGAADVIFHTENIQLLRALERSMRYRYSDQATQDKIKEINADATLSPEDKVSLLNDLLTRDVSKHNGFINWISEYANIIANKKSYADRPDEKRFGRSLTYRLSLWWQRNYAANMVLYNVSSALSNTVALQQAFSELNHRDFARGMYDTIKNIKESDGFEDKSDFLTNRKGALIAGKSKLQKFGEAANLMEHTDLFVSQAIVRARYYENMRVRKMSEAEALAEADNYAKSVIAGRAKGDLPLIFTEKNFSTRLFTAFQLEVNNQLQNLFKDAPKRILKDKGIKGLANYIIKYLISAYLYNEFYEKITGRKIAIDPLGFVESCIESYTGIKIPNKLDMIGCDKITYGKKPEGVDKVFNVTKTAFTEATDQIPFIGSLLGGGRIPAAVTIPDMASIGSSIKNLATGEGDVGKNVENLITDGVVPLAYGLNPYGGLNQVKKTIQGISTVAKGEVVDNKGKLKYGVEQTPSNYIKGTIFGPSSLKDTRDFYDAGGKGLTDTEQKYYDNVTGNGVSKYEAYQNVIGVRNAKNEISRKNTFYRIMSNDKFVGNVQLGADNAAYQEIMRLKKADTGISLDYTVPDNSFKVNGEDVFLTNAKYRKYASECSRSALDGIKTLIATNYYKKASDVEKAELIEEIYSYSKGISKTKVSKYEPESDVLKATLAKESKVSVGDYFTFKKQLPEKYNEADAYSLTQELKMSEEQATMLTNLSKYSYDQCKRLQDAGGFKYSQQVRRLYTSMRQRGYDCDTIYAPMVSKKFSYSNKKQGISYETQLSDDDMLKLQKVYLHLYEKKLGEAFQHNYRSIESLYDTVESARYSTMTEAKKIFYQYLQQKK